MHNVDLSAKGGLEFSKLPHKRLGQEISSLDSGDFSKSFEIGFGDDRKYNTTYGESES